jgi:hypothetical protein
MDVSGQLHSRAPTPAERAPVLRAVAKRKLPGPTGRLARMDGPKSSSASIQHCLTNLLILLIFMIFNRGVSVADEIRA